MRLESTDPPFG